MMPYESPPPVTELMFRVVNAIGVAIVVLFCLASSCVAWMCS